MDWQIFYSERLQEFTATEIRKGELRESIDLVPLAKLKNHNILDDKISTPYNENYSENPKNDLNNTEVIEKVI